MYDAGDYIQHLTNGLCRVEKVTTLDFAIHAFRIYLCMMVFACVNKACFIFLQAMGKVVESTALSMIREIVFGVGLALLLPVFFGLDGVLYSMPLSDILTFVLTVYLIIKTYGELSRGMIKITVFKKPLKTHFPGVLRGFFFI